MTHINKNIQKHRKQIKQPTKCTNRASRSHFVSAGRFLYRFSASHGARKVMEQGFGGSVSWYADPQLRARDGSNWEQYRMDYCVWDAWSSLVVQKHPKTEAELRIAVSQAWSELRMRLVLQQLLQKRATTVKAGGDDSERSDIAISSESLGCCLCIAQICWGSAFAVHKWKTAKHAKKGSRLGKTFKSM